MVVKMKVLMMESVVSQLSVSCQSVSQLLVSQSFVSQECFQTTKKFIWKEKFLSGGQGVRKQAHDA